MAGGSDLLAGLVGGGVIGCLERGVGGRGL